MAYSRSRSRERVAAALRENHPEESIPPTQLRPVNFPVEDGQLLAQREILRHERCSWRDQAPDEEKESGDEDHKCEANHRKKDELDDRAEWLMIHLTASISRRDEVFGRDTACSRARCAAAWRCSSAAIFRSRFAPPSESRKSLRSNTRPATSRKSMPSSTRAGRRPMARCSSSRSS